MDAAVRAYANVPTGDELHLSWTEDKKHIKATITDMDGKVIEKQLMTPEEMGAFAMGVNPSSYVSFISQAAGREDKTISQAAADKMGMPNVAGLTEEQVRIKQAQEEAGKKDKLSPTELGEARTDVATELDNFITKNPTLEKFFNDEAKGRRDDLQTASEQLLINNVEIGPRNAVAATMDILAKGLSEPPVMSDDDPMAKINVEGLGQLTLPKETYKTLVTLRKMGEFREGAFGPPAPGKSFSDYLPTSTPDAVPAPNFYAIKPPAVYDPNRVDPIIETVKKAWEGLTAVPTGPIPPYNPSGRPGYGQPMNRPKGNKNYLQR
jgi:hypothetical protein